MSPIAITLLLLVVAIVLFAIEKFPVDVVGLVLVVAMVLTGVLTMQESVAGFGNDIIITIGGLFILVGGLIKTGLVDLIGRRLHRLAGDSELVLTALIMAVAALSASVLKNKTTTAMFLRTVSPSMRIRSSADRRHHIVDTPERDGAGVDRLAAGGLFAQLGDVHVAVEGEHQGPRYRRRR